MSKSLVICTTALGLFLLSPPSHAYLDPGTGSMIIQGLIAAIAAASIAGKMYWHRFMVFLGKREDTGTADNDLENSEPPKSD